MAIQGRGYYGIGATKKDFGFSSNLTLPLSGGYNTPSSSGMPQESGTGSTRSHTRLAVDKGEMAAYGTEKKSKSWKSRINSIFGRNKKKDKDLVSKGGGSTKSDKVKSRLEKQEESEAHNEESETAQMDLDDVNAQILSQEGLTQDSDEQDNEEGMLLKELDKGPLEDDEGSDVIVPPEVEVVYDEDLADENDLQGQASPAKDHYDNELKVDPELEIEEQSEKEPASRVESNMITSPSGKQNKKKTSQESKEKHKKKKTKVEKRKSAALETSTHAQHWDEETGKKNGKKNKQRPKSMPAASLMLADEQATAKVDSAVESSGTTEVAKRKSNGRKARVNADTAETPPEDKQKSTLKGSNEGNTATGDEGTEEMMGLIDTKQVTKKTKPKKAGAKNGAAPEGEKVKSSTPKDSPGVKKKSKKAKQKAVASEETFDSPMSGASPPPLDEIQVPKQQVTVGVIKKKKQKTRPFLEVDGAPKSNVYRSDISGQKQEEDDTDEDEKQLLHDMDTLQLMAEGDEKASDKKDKKKRQSKALDGAEGVTEVARETKEGKKSKVSKGTKAKKYEAEPEVQPPQPVEVEVDMDKKPPKKTKKTKGKGHTEPEAEVIVQSPPQAEAVSEMDGKKAKKTKKSKGKSEPVGEPEVQPLLQTEEEKVEKKPVKKTKKTKSKGKSEPAPEQEVQTLRQEEHEDTPKSGKKKSVKKTKSKGKVVEETDVAVPETPTKAAAAQVEDDVGGKKSKKKIKKLLSKSSIGSSEGKQQSNGGTPSNRSSRSQLSKKTSKSKIASEESDDLVWVGADRLPKKKKTGSKDDTAVDEEPEAMNLSSSSRSTSYHELSKEERKIFQDELRKASSQHSVDGGEGGVKVEIDPNVKVTKSGVVKGGKGSRRPSLQVDFVGSGMEQIDSGSPNEEKGSGEKSKKVSMDLSAVPQTTPSLGLTHGHDKLDLISRSASKRRPMSTTRESLLLNKEEAAGGSKSPPQNNILAAHLSKLQKTSGGSNGSSRNSASLVYQAAVAKSQQREGSSGHGMPLARQLFPSAPNGETKSGEGSESSTLERSRRNKTVDKPVKTLGIASENSSAAGATSSPPVPSWVALAKNKQKRSSLLLAEKEEDKTSVSPAKASTPTPTTTTTTAASAAGGARGRQGADSTIPKMGTVQARLAAFERK